jgi:predicted transcriptional regulator
MKGKKRERILRILLNNPDGSLSFYRIAKEADCSHVWVIAFLRNLELKGLVKNRKVTDVEGLFAYWLQINPQPSFREYHVQNPLEMLNKTTVKYALTTYYAESLTQNYLFPSRVDIYIEEHDLQAWHKLLTTSGLVGKGNFRLLIDDHHVFYSIKQIRGYTIVSMPQLIFDLLREQGVAVEAAHMLMEREYQS